MNNEVNNEFNNSNTGINNNYNNNQPMNNGINNFNTGANNNYNNNQPMYDDSLSNNKTVKNLKNDFFALAVLSLLVAIGTFLLYEKNTYIIIRVVLQLGYTLLLFWGYTKAKNEENSAGTLGIVIGILMIISSSILDAILRIFLLIHSINYKKRL